MNSLRFWERFVADGIATALLMIARGITFSIETLSGWCNNFTNTKAISETNNANRTIAEEMAFMMVSVFSFSNLRSRLASITIRISPSVPITGRKGFKLGICSPVALAMIWIIMPSPMSRITPGILVYLPLMSNIYERKTIRQSARMM